MFDRIENHPADRIYRSGVSMSISTDARTIKPVTLADEYALLEKTFNWQKEHFLKCNLEAVSHSFVDDATRQLLREKILAGYKS
ncbi:adenosine deaminase, partial [Salmonella enterica subsp. enterica serovar Typhimurium]|nr:adenosine deaminase [Salmonella enterica subsp. enterica serovar Typhimurium]